MIAMGCASIISLYHAFFLLVHLHIKAGKTLRTLLVNTVLYGRCGPFPAALEALKQKAVKDLLGNMITAIYPISDGIQAFEKAKSKGSLKVLLDMKEKS